ncbi:hypothetical protein SB6415_00042 [Klebsiella pasteurii]|nr:hypothetical protein SB6415_00042 [Klebsiella pasteurii]
MALQITGSNMNGSPELSLSGGNSTVFAWSPFGGGTARTGNAASLPGFNGERQDPLSGVTHLGNGYRAYSPALRRFTCPDSESPFRGGGINPYVYCDHDPVNNTDPSGHMPKKTAEEMEAATRARMAALNAGKAQAEALPAALPQPRRTNGATGTTAAQVRQRAAPAAAVQGAPQQRTRPPQRTRAPAIASTSGQANSSASNLVKPAPLSVLKMKATEDAKAAARFEDYHDVRHHFRIDIHEGKLWHAGSLLTTSEDGGFKFIQDEDGSLYGVESYEHSDFPKHTSLLGESWPISAGTMIVDRGRVIKISNGSGHFHPAKKNLEYTKKFLENSGVKVRGDDLFQTEGNPERLKETVSQYRAKYLNAASR